MKQQTNAWYSQFWPWFLILLPGSVVIASIATIIIASRNPDGMVVDDYYKAGLAINRNLSREQQADILNIQCTLKIIRHSNRVQLQIASNTAIQGEQLQLHILHPTLPNKDQKITLLRLDASSYNGHIKPLTNGTWNVILSSKTPSWRIQKRINVSDTIQAYILR